MNYFLALLVPAIFLASFISRAFIKSLKKPSFLFALTHVFAP